MNDQQALLISQAAAAMITAMGMQAENQQREALGQSMAYTNEDFQEVIKEHSLGWNAAVTLLRGE